MSPDEADFCIYAGITINAENAGDLSDEIELIRANDGYEREDLLKFNTHQRPNHTDVDAHRNAKSELLDAAAQFGAVIFASFILHELATSPDEFVTNFDCLLSREKDGGIVLLDTFTDKELASSRAGD